MLRVFTGEEVPGGGGEAEKDPDELHPVIVKIESTDHDMTIVEWAEFLLRTLPDEYRERDEAEYPEVVTLGNHPVYMTSLWDLCWSHLSETHRELARLKRIALPYIEVMARRVQADILPKHSGDLVIESIPIIGRLVHHLNNGEHEAGTFMVWPMEWKIKKRKKHEGTDRNRPQAA